VLIIALLLLDARESERRRVSACLPVMPLPACLPVLTLLFNGIAW